jgi:hypothetical protein
MKEFDNRLREYGEYLKKQHYPHSETDLRKELRSIIWHTPRVEPQPLPRQRMPHPALWRTVLVAAVLLALLVPVGFLATQGGEDIAQVSQDGQQFYFLCNNHCSPMQTLNYFNTIIR